MIYQLIIKKDFQEINYKRKIIQDFFSVLLRVVIFFFITEFIISNNSNNSGNLNYFIFFITGICLLDLMTSMVTAIPSMTNRLKIEGTLNEILLLPVSLMKYWALSSLSLLSSITIKLIFYIIVAYAFSGHILFSQNDLFINFVALASLLTSSFLMSIIFASHVINASNTHVYLNGFISITVIMGGIFFPTSLILHEFNALSLFMHISAPLSLLRISLESSGFNEYILLLVCLIYPLILFFIAKTLTSYSIKKYKENGKIVMN